MLISTVSHSMTGFHATPDIIYLMMILVTKMITLAISRVSLSTTGFHATPDIGYDFQTNSGNAFNYFTFGVGCSTVEIDCLTGDHHVLRCGRLKIDTIMR